MALVCDLKSDPIKVEPKPENTEDLEDGEIEDGEIEDDDDDQVMEEQPPVENAAPPVVPPKPDENKIEKIDRDRPRDRSKEKRDKRHKDKDTRHMTEAEKSILHLRRKERMERERDKWSRRKEHQNIEPQDDFAIKLEKTLASILKKDKVTSDEDKEEEHRGKRKRKNKDSDHPNKHHKSNSPSEVDEKEMLNMRGGSPEQLKMDKDERPKSPRSDSYDSEYASDQPPSKNEEKPNRGRRENNRREGKKNNKSKNKNRDRNFKKEKSRENKQEQIADSKGICIFYLNGKCNKNDCIYSHEAVPPMKLELCKFYLMDCCAKGDNCSYMHSDFPCKFYHMGLPCNMGDKCKFAHGEPLSDGLKQILFKHIETAPKDILGGFPRLSREETLQMMDDTQKNLMGVYKEQDEKDSGDKEENSEDGSIPSLFDISVPVPRELKDEPSESKAKNTEKSGRNKPSRWQVAEPKEKASSGPMNFGPFNFSQDQDMRVNSNGDIDMRTLPPHPLSSLPQPLPSSLMSSDLSRMNPNNNTLRNSKGDVDIRNLSPNFASDVDIRLQSTFEGKDKPGDAGHPSSFLGSKDVDIRQMRLPPPVGMDEENGAETEDAKDDSDSMNVLSNLPKMQRELYLRIQSQQKENPPVFNDYEDNSQEYVNNDEDWYSDDDDEHRLTIKDDNDEVDAAEQKEEKPEVVQFPGLPKIEPLGSKPQEVVEKIGDLSKINITADITKLLSSLSSSLPAVPKSEPSTPPAAFRDPRQARVTINSPTRSPTSASTGEAGAPLAPRTLYDPRLAPQEPSTKPSQASEAPRDPRRSGTVAASKSDKMSIYEQGGLNMDEGDGAEAYKASGRPDVDLRTLGLPFKGMESYTPATEIDASCGAHPPVPWKVIEVEVPRPDYSGLKLSLDEAEKTGDPRLRKIFRLSVEERDTPMSPKESPQRPTGVRIDPRLRKAEEAKSSEPSSMNYTQQLSTLQSSGFYQSLTSNQKLMLNQELASRSDQTGSHDPILNGILASLNLLPGIAGLQQGGNLGVAANILQNIGKMTAQLAPGMINNNMMAAQGMLQPGLLGAAPGIPNMSQQDFPMSFDPRHNNNGLLGNGPQQQYPPFDQPQVQGGYQNYPNEDYYPQDNNQSGFRGNQGRNEGRGNFNNRERRRGGRNNSFGRNQGRNQFRRNQGGRQNKNHIQ